MGALVLRGGTVFTADPAGSMCTAVAVEDGRIVAVGGDRDIGPYLHGAAQVVELGGRMLLPGFTDAHVHPVAGGIERNRCDLTGGETIEEYRTAISAYAAAHPPVSADASWILGGGWSMGAFPGGVPHRQLLDELVGDRPAFLPNRDHHSAWVSSAALRLAGIDRTCPDPEDGRIERDAAGEPTGALHEGAMALVEAVAPAPTQAEHDAGLRTALAHLNSLGIVGWQDALVSTETTVPNVLDSYRRADADGWLTARVRGALWWERDTTAAAIDGEVTRLAALRDEVNATQNGKFGICSVKVMLDGVAETHTAAMVEPYLDGCGCATTNHGISFLDPRLLHRVVTAVDAADFQLHFHALGDRAVRDALDAVEAAIKANGSSDHRHHAAHLQFVDAADVERFRQLNLTANLQSLWAAHEPQVDALTEPFVGAGRAARMYPFGELARAGATLAMGSDWPVSTADPIQAIHVAVNRISPLAPAGAPPLGVRQELLLRTALRAYTAGSARLNRWPDATGTLYVGAPADLVVLDNDPFAVPTSDIGHLRVDHTFVDGVEVFTRQS